MINKFKRPLTDKEKRVLRASSSSLKQYMNKLGKRIVISGFILTGVLWGLTMLVAKESWTTITAFWLCTGTGISIWSILSERQKLRKRVNAAESAMMRNEAEVLQIQSAEMIEFDEIEDEGACYAYQVDDESILFIEGQDFYASAKFPNNNFEIVHIYDAAQKLVEMIIDKHGDKLRPIRKIASEDKKKLKLPDHLEVVKGKLSNIEQILKA